MEAIEARYVPYTDKLYVCGKTYEIREKLKALGFRWSPSEECWVREVPPRKVAEAVKELQEKLGVKVSYQPLAEAIKCLEYAGIVIEGTARELEDEKIFSVSKTINDVLKFLQERRSDIEWALFERKAKAKGLSWL
jgi:hypothetical protein